MEKHEGDICETCLEGVLIYQSIHKNTSCSCHINPPCFYCTDQELVCGNCNEVAIEYKPLSREGYNSAFWKPEPFKPFKVGNGVITSCTCNSSSGSTMVYEGTYEGNITNQDLLEHFGSGTFGHRLGFCGGGRFKFTKITD